MTQRGAAALMLMAVSGDAIRQAMSALNARLPVVTGQPDGPDAPKVPEIGDE